MQRWLAIGLVLGLVAIVAGEAAAHPKVQGREVEYRDNGTVMKGYYAVDVSKTGKRPGVLVVHEWWGHNEYARKRARMLAELGYAALAVDMYGDAKQAAHPEDAGKFASEVMKNFETGKGRFNAAVDFLRREPDVDPDRIAAIGYCFGGFVVLNMARQGADLKGVASFHGNLAAVKPAETGKVKAKILVLHGADDTFITQEQIDAFKEEMKKAHADMRFISYAGAKHSFTNPDADEFGKKFNMPLAYDADADARSWAELKKFLEGIFGT